MAVSMNQADYLGKQKRYEKVRQWRSSSQICGTTQMKFKRPHKLHKITKDQSSKTQASITPIYERPKMDKNGMTLKSKFVSPRKTTHNVPEVDEND